VDALTPQPDPATRPVPQPEPSPWNIANALTVLRLFLVPVFGWLLLFDGGEDTTLRWLAGLAFAVALATDRIDGDLARSRGLVTRFGQVADPIADKALISMALGGLSVIGDVPWWVTILVLVREWGITLLRFWVIRHGILPASRGGKLKTFLQGLALWLMILPLAALPGGSFWHFLAWVILWAAVAVTLVTGVDYVFRALRLRQTSERAAAKRAARAARGR
jgi:CDP-diacylglycerol--glycerol-3-phosphate 3-phosphatidyltransferase